jgi:hypothetical protein
MSSNIKERERTSAKNQSAKIRASKIKERRDASAKARNLRFKKEGESESVRGFHPKAQKRKRKDQKSACSALMFGLIFQLPVARKQYTGWVNSYQRRCLPKVCEQSS